MRVVVTLSLVAILLGTPVAPKLPAADPVPAPPAKVDQAGIDFFEKKIRPVLTDHCANCHSADAEKNKKLKGNLFLDTRDGLLKGGDTGPAIVPGKPAESLLLKSLHYGDELKMPPKGKLPDAVITDFEKWIAMGAPDPRTAAAVVPRRQVGMTVEEGRKFWAYQLPKQPQIPVSREPKASAIDALVLARLEAKNLKPAPDADRATLVRRVYFDLIGLPPSPEEVDAFVNDKSPDAYERLVDKLLASPQFGERWGRHWLDVARYAESVTLRGFVFKEAWRYRDYVIDAFNARPALRPLHPEQIAGDLLPADRRPTTAARQLIATTFLRLGNTNLEEQDKKQLRMDVVDEQLDVITKGFLGQTVTCARCHDHKFDPIPTKDYYALAGILRNAQGAGTRERVEVARGAAAGRPGARGADQEARGGGRGAAGEADRGEGAGGDQGGCRRARGEGRARRRGRRRAGEEGRRVDALDAQFDVHRRRLPARRRQGQGREDAHLPAGDRRRRAGTRCGSRTRPAPAGRRTCRFTCSAPTARRRSPVNMQKNPPIDGRFVSLGEYKFEKGGLSFVLVSNEDTKGHVVPGRGRVPAARQERTERPEGRESGRRR